VRALCRAGAGLWSDTDQAARGEVRDPSGHAVPKVAATGGGPSGRRAPEGHSGRGGADGQAATDGRSGILWWPRGGRVGRERRVMRPPRHVDGGCVSNSPSGGVPFFFINAVL
jgi:hypothetical protein